MPRLAECEFCSKIPWTPWAKKRCLCEGFVLDLGCGEGKDKGYIGMDRRAVPGVDIVWDLESVGALPWWARNLPGAKPEPWPIPSNSVDRLVCAHLFEHITPGVFPAVMDEMWRVMKFDGQAMIVVPHGDSYGFRQDPTHIAMFNESTFDYFDPGKGGLYLIYKPKPWLIRNLHSSPHHNMQVILETRKKPDGTAVDITVEKGKKRRPLAVAQSNRSSFRSKTNARTRGRKKK
jgi:SAM-dependent methyltransferase